MVQIAEIKLSICHANRSEFYSFASKIRGSGGVVENKKAVAKNLYT
ncbi:hypothetical protein RBSWK_00532 [Rhodopirellula baltica SWK14]|uniref:Uncharacterized protein n=1 Tax=Rhodopirellula baltica SWK14 TaxID=993516 RepID=L7CML7_RHOBT|nr:hypothetical protein RBSWK_00532 [Rhodopirellula baltica SWK14]